MVNNKIRKVAFLTLGCKTNQYETNGMMQKFIEAGYEICEIEEMPDIYIVNTCTVTNMSDRKSRQAIRKVKVNNNDVIVVAVGCYAQVAKDKLKEMEEIDVVLGNKEKKDIVKYIEDFINVREQKEDIDNNIDKIVDVADISKQKDFDEYGCITYSEKSRTTIKIQDGCNNFCTYCLIPYARGRIRSRNKENILKEVEEITQTGIKEIVLTGIHIASYGKDFSDLHDEGNNYMLIDLLEDLNKIKGLERIRLGSLEPTIITTDFVKRLSKLEKICPHFHLSLQSGCNDTLKRMNRKYTTEQFKQVTDLLRENFKDVNLTTDVIVGFPGETEEEFEKTYQFLKDICFYKMHIFKYSKRDGTPAASMPNQVDGNIQEERSKKLIDLSDNNQKMYNKQYIGKDIKVLFEEEQGDYWIGRTANYMVVKVKYKKNNFENKLNTIDGLESKQFIMENLENKLATVRIYDIEEEELLGELI